MDIEVIGMTWYTVHLSGKDVELVKQWIWEHEDDLPYFDMKQNIAKAVWELYSEGKISLYDDDKCTESDFNTEEIRWSEYEERKPEDILGWKVNNMKSYKYYDVLHIVDEMSDNKELDCYPTGDDKFEGVYVCMDTNNFWIARINKGYNGGYDREDGKYLVERNRISIYDVMDRLYELYKKKLPEFKDSDLQYELKNKCHDYFRLFKERDIIKAVIYLDDFDGLSNWDCYEADSLEEAIDIIDGGYGILHVA